MIQKKNNSTGIKIIHRSLAIFLLSASVTAVAETKLAVHGSLDVCIEHVDTGSSSVFIQESAGQTGSRVKLNGSEDINEDLKIIFILEAGLNINKGTSSQGGRIFGRQAWLGLQSSVGSLTFGRQYTPMDDYGEDIADAFSGGYNGSFLFLQGNTKGKLDLAKTGNSMASNSLVDWSSGNGVFSIDQPYGLRVDDSIKYVTPTLHGFSGTAMYSFGQRIGEKSSGMQTGLAIRYMGDAINLGIGYHQIVGTKGVVLFNQNGTGTFSPEPDTITQKTGALAASYNFGTFRLYGNYEQTNFENFNSRDYGISGLYNMTSNLDFITGMVKKIVSMSDELNAIQYSIAVKYSLTKLTSIYSSYSKIKNSGNEQFGSTYIPTYALSASSGASTDSLMVGLRHDF